MARVIRESVSDTIANRLSDPRIQGIVSVTDVDISPDLRNADVFLSIMATDEKHRRRTMEAIQHAERHIQARLGRKMTSKFCPRLHFYEDTKLSKTLETLRLIDAAAEEYRSSEDQTGAQTENGQD